MRVRKNITLSQPVATMAEETMKARGFCTEREFSEYLACLIREDFDRQKEKQLKRN